MSDPTITAAETAAESTETAATAEPTETAETAAVAVPEPVTVGSLLARHRIDDPEPLLGIVTADDRGNLTVRDASGNRHTVYASYIDGNYAWKRAQISVGSGVTAILASLAAQLSGTETRLREARESGARELDMFRDRVRSVAMEYAERNDWCAEVARALAELGIDVTREVTVSGTFSVSMSLPWGSTGNDVSTRDVLEALSHWDLTVEDVEDSE